MTKEELIKNQFPNDEFLQSGVLQIVDKCVADLEKENAELKEKVSFLEDNLRVARKDRENLQLYIAKGLKEFVKDCPATSLRYLANEKYVERFDKAKELLLELYDCIPSSMADSCRETLQKVALFFKDSEASE